MDGDERCWCWNSKTGEIFSYRQSGSLTDFPRGTFLAYGDYLVTGFASRAKSVEYASKNGPCPKCKASRTRGKCWMCGGEVGAAPEPK